jgi:chemotaxis protein CheX
MNLVKETMTTQIATETLPGEIPPVVESIFGTMLNLEVVPGLFALDPCADRMTSTVQLSGAWTGAVVFECDRDQACRLAGRFLSIDPPVAVDDLVRDVLGELANMIGGNMKCVLSGSLRLSMPCVVDGGDHHMRIPGVSLRERLSFQSIEGPFWIGLLELKNHDPARSWLLDSRKT